MAEIVCTHLADVDADGVAPRPPDGCAECQETGGTWVHLRMCAVCGHVGCCDSSPSRHASAHARHGGHPLVRSYEPGEAWWWCYVDEVAFELAGRGPLTDRHHAPGG
ncbi:MAG TPA: UBP-type zinc finger domain-containing protein [Euzebyales bacterium]